MALLPDPSPRERQHILISVDNHVIEPPDMFDGRQVWRYEDREHPNIGLKAVSGRPKQEWSMEAARFHEMRRGRWDIDARIAGSIGRPVERAERSAGAGHQGCGVSVTGGPAGGVHR